jgi:hypothetical protein
MHISPNGLAHVADILAPGAFGSEKLQPQTSSFLLPEITVYAELTHWSSVAHRRIYRLVAQMPGAVQTPYSVARMTKARGSLACIIQRGIRSHNGRSPGSECEIKRYKNQSQWLLFSFWNKAYNAHTSTHC